MQEGPGACYLGYFLEKDGAISCIRAFRIFNTNSVSFSTNFLSILSSDIVHIFCLDNYQLLVRHQQILLVRHAVQTELEYWCGDYRTCPARGYGHSRSNAASSSSRVCTEGVISRIFRPRMCDKYLRGFKLEPEIMAPKKASDA